MSEVKTEDKLEQLEALMEQLEALIEAAERYIEELDENRALATLQAARQIITAA